MKQQQEYPTVEFGVGCVVDDVSRVDNSLSSAANCASPRPTATNNELRRARKKELQILVCAAAVPRDGAPDAIASQPPPPAIQAVDQPTLHQTAKTADERECHWRASRPASAVMAQASDRVYFPPLEECLKGSQEVMYVARLLLSPLLLVLTEVFLKLVETSCHCALRSVRRTSNR